MVFQGRHGARPREREQAQAFTVDVEVECDVAKAAASDDLEDTIDYTKLRAIVQEIVEGPHVNLLETLATRIVQRVLEERGVSAVSLRVAKRPPSMQPIDSAAVRIRRTRAGSE